MQKEQNNTTTAIEPRKKNAEGTSLSALSEQLKPLVQQLERDKSLCLAGLGQAANTAAAIGQILHEADQLELPGFSAIVWAEDHGIRGADAGRYMSIAEKIRTTKIDEVPARTLLVALELLPETSGRATAPADQKTPTFQVHLNKLGQWFTDDRVAEMPQWLRSTVVKQLEELLARLKVASA